MEQYSQSHVRISGIKEEGYPIHVPVTDTEAKAYSTVVKCAHTENRPGNADETTPVVITPLNTIIPHINLKENALT